MEEAATQEVAAAGPARVPARTHATTLLYVLALVLSVTAWTRVGRDPFVIDRRAFWGEPWRLLSARFVHESAAAFVIGIVGTAYFGRILERRIGTRSLFGVCALLVPGIGLAEYAFDCGGTGLTGVVCGLWAMLVVGSLFDRSLRGAVPAGVSVLMLAAYLLCFVAPQISNYGHTAGVALGVLAGLCLDREGKLRFAFAPLALVALLLCAHGATLWRRSWNLGGASLECDRAGLVAFARGDEDLAERELRMALQFDPHDGQAWWDLGLVLARLGRDEETAEACWHAYENRTLSPEERNYLEQVQLWALNQHLANKETAKAFASAKNVAKLLPEDLEVWENVRELAEQLGDKDWLERAEQACARLGHAQH